MSVQDSVAPSLTMADREDARGQRLRIVLLTEATAAGVGRHVIDLATSLSARGHELHVLYSSARIDSRFQSGIERLRNYGVRTSIVEMAHKPHASDLDAVRAIRSYISRHLAPDIIHSHSTKAGLVGRIAAMRTPCLSVYSPHAFLTMSPALNSLSRFCTSGLERGLSRITHGIVCVSDQEREHAKSIGIPREKLFVVNNGIEPPATPVDEVQRVQARKRLNIDEKSLCLGFVGRLSSQKSPGVLLDVLRKLASGPLKNVKLILAGDGPLGPELRQRIQAYSLGSTARIISGVQSAEVMAAFDVFILTSLYEGFPYVLLEALSMGLPIISTDVGGARDMVHHGVNGFIVEDASPETIARYVTNVLNDNALRLRLSRESLALSSRFSLASMAGKMEQVYFHLLSKQHPSTPLQAGSSM